MSSRTEETRSAIVQAALATFCVRGYRVATLAEIGAQVGLTRSGVLHHFKSKPELLGAVAEPCRRALTDLLHSVEVDDPPTRSQRHRLLTSFADLMLEHRGAWGLLTNDVSARAQLEPGDRWPALLRRLVTLLAGSNATILTQLRVTAALGAMVQPVTSAWLNLEDAGTSGELIDAALAVIDGPRSPVLTAAS